MNYFEKAPVYRKEENLKKTKTVVMYIGLLVGQLSCSTSGYLAAYCVSSIIQTPMTVAKLVTSGFGHTGGLSYIIVHHALTIMIKKI